VTRYVVDEITKSAVDGEAIGIGVIIVVIITFLWIMGGPKK
jgi:hypothetical protein